MELKAGTVVIIGGAQGIANYAHAGSVTRPILLEVADDRSVMEDVNPWMPDLNSWMPELNSWAFKAW